MRFNVGDKVILHPNLAIDRSNPPRGVVVNANHKYAEVAFADHMLNTMAFEQNTNNIVKLEESNNILKGLL